MSSFILQGPREYEGIVKYLRKQAGPSIKVMTSADDITALTSKNPVVVVAYLSSDKARMATRFEEIANKLRDDYVFASLVGEDAIKAAGMEQSSM